MQRLSWQIALPRKIREYAIWLGSRGNPGVPDFVGRNYAGNARPARGRIALRARAGNFSALKRNFYSDRGYSLCEIPAGFHNGRGLFAPEDVQFGGFL